MFIGCLTRSDPRPQLDGRYSYHAPGLQAPLDPDLLPDSSARTFADGALTGAPHGAVEQCVVAWSAAAVGDTGVDVVIELGWPCFVDRVIVRPPASRPAHAGHSAVAATPDTGNIEAAGHVEPDGLSRVEVYACSFPSGEETLAGYTGECGPDVLDGPVTVHAGVEATRLVVRLISFRRDIRLAGIEVWGEGLGGPSLFPIPAQMEQLPGPHFVLGPDCTIQVSAPAGAGAEDQGFAATLLAEKLAELYGWTLPVSTREGLNAGTLLIGRPERLARLAAARLPAPDEPEGYTFRVDRRGAVLLANDRRGWIYGVETLLQLLASGARSGAQASAAPCLIRDAPRLPFRGVHLFVPARDQIAYTKRLIRYLLAPMKLNTIFLELAGGMRFERHPEINEAWAENNRLAAEGKGYPVPHGAVGRGGWLTQAEVKDLVEYARSYGIEVIPEIQSLSHVQYLTMTYPEIAESPVTGDLAVENGYPDSYCPLHPKSHEIVFDMIDEVVELLGPLRYLHMGHDEVYTMAECPRCKGKTRDELFAYDVNAIHGYLKSKGIQMMIWADMLQPWQRYAAQNVAPLIPKDVVLLEFVWYFRPWADTEDLLLENGFQVIFGNCYSSHFTRYERRTRKEGVIGAQISVWAATDEETMGRLGKLYDLAYSANLSWSATCQEALRWTFDRRIAGLMPGIRARLSGRPAALAARAPQGVPLDLETVYNAPRRDPSGVRGGYDLTTLPSGKTTLRGLLVQFGAGLILVESQNARARAAPERVTIPVPARADALVFAHCCTAMAHIQQAIGPRPTIAGYTIEYADGTTEQVEVAYGHHVAEWNRRHGAPLGPRFFRHAGYVATYPVDPLWQGKTARGEDVTLYGLEWVNPRPEVPLRAVHVQALEGGTDAALLVAGITVVRET